MKIPAKYSDAEARAILLQKMQDKTLPVGERRKLQDQYMEYSKGGDVKKKTKLAKGGVVKKKKV